MPVKTGPRGALAAATHLRNAGRTVLAGEANHPERRPSRDRTDARAVALRILVVEDEALVAEATMSVLKRAGYDPVATAASGEEAVRQALVHRPDAILMDIRLREPQGDGIQAAAEIRASVDCAIVFVTAHSDPDTVARAAATDPDGYLTKPYSAQQLFDAIDTAVRRRRDRG